MLTSLYAKVMVKYGRMLTADDYNALKNAPDVSQIAKYLKSTPAYSAAFDGLDTRLMHRGQIETAVRRAVWDEYTGLLKYAASDDGSHFLQYLKVQTEIGQILAYTALLNFGQTERYALVMPQYLAHGLAFDLFSLASVKSYAQLCEFLSGTRYGAVLTRFKPDNGAAVRVPLLEAALLRDMYSSLITDPDSRDKPKDPVIDDFFKTKLDLENILRLLRLRQNFGLSGDDVKDCLIGKPCNIGKKALHEMLFCDKDELFALLMSTPYRHVFDSVDPSRAERAADQWLISKAKHILRAGTSPAAAAAAYIELRQFETRTVIGICESVRYGVAPV